MRAGVLSRNGVKTLALCTQFDTVLVAEAQPAVEDVAFRQVFSHRTADVNGVRLHYVMGGKGDPVVLLHGFTSTWYEWRKVMPALAEQYTVIVPDLRGLGDSERPEGEYDKRTLGEDIYQLVTKLWLQPHLSCRT